MTIKLSPSASSRWLKCPGSVLREAGLQDETSIYAKEGIEAHLIAAKILKGEPIQIKCSIHIIDYVNYIWKLRNSCTGKFVEFVEYEVSATDKSLPLKGTADYVLLDIESKHLHVVDLKYGKGIKVEAKDNTQLLIYASLVYDTLGFSYKINQITLHIHQPRIRNVCAETITVEELTNKIGRIYEVGKIALQNNAPIKPGKLTCQFCKAKTICKEHQKFKTEEANFGFEKLN